MHRTTFQHTRNKDAKDKAYISRFNTVRRRISDTLTHNLQCGNRDDRDRGNSSTLGTGTPKSTSRIVMGTETHRDETTRTKTTSATRKDSGCKECCG